MVIAFSSADYADYANSKKGISHEKAQKGQKKISDSGSILAKSCFPLGFHFVLLVPFCGRGFSYLRNLCNLRMDLI